MTSSPAKLIGRFGVDTGFGNFLGDTRIRLLEQIDAFGSISRAAKEVPLSYKAAWDAIDAMNNLAESVIGHHSETYVPLMCSFFLFILLCNFIGMIPGFAPPTSNFNITLALGTVSFLAFNYWGFKKQGVGYLKHFVGPIWWLAVLMVPLEIIGALVRPFSLGLRLFGNLFGDHLVLEIFTDLTRVVVPVVFYLLGTLVTVIQAFVFTLLSMIYIALAVSHHEEEADLL